MPRTTITGRGIVLAAVLAVGVTACTPPLPPDVLAAQAENNITCQTGNVDAMVPEEFAGALDAVGLGLSGVCPDQTVTEVADDATARLQLIDSAPTEEQVAEFEATACTTGNAIVVPAFGYPVALSYDVIGLEGLVLTPEAIAGILSSTVTSWEDPLIAEANADYDLTGLPEITVLSVDQPEGAVTAMTTWLTETVPDKWTAGVTGTLSVGQQFPTTTDLLSELTLTEGTVAVLPVFAAITAGMPIAAVPVQDLIISPDDTQLPKVGVAATTITTDEAGNMFATPAIGGVPVEGNFDLAASKIVLADGQPLIGWPIVGIAHLMVCDDPSDPLPLSAAQYALRLAGQGAFETFGVTPLPEPIRIQTFAPLKVSAPAPSASES